MVTQKRRSKPRLKRTKTLKESSDPEESLKSYEKGEGVGEVNKKDGWIFR